MSFNLLRDPWIPVLGSDGPAMVGIVEALTNAPTLRGLACGNVMEKVSITRLLLAWLHRSLQGPADVDAWLDIHRAGHFDAAAIERYASEWEHRFELTGETPFFQTPDMEPIITQPWSGKSPTELELFFPGARPEITPAEAARWLVAVQSFDGAGIKKPHPADPGAKGGRSYGSPRGWTDRLANIQAVGDTLFATLLANLVAYHYTPQDRPAWENPVTTWLHNRLPEESPLRRDKDKVWACNRTPQGRCDVYTWQADRLLLRFDEDGRIIGYSRGSGDDADPASMMAIEPLTLWRHNINGSKKANRIVFDPACYDFPDRLWTGIEMILPTRPAEDGKVIVPPAGIVEWIATVEAASGMELDLRWETTVMVRDGYGTVVKRVLTDGLDFPTRALADPALGAFLGQQVERLLDDTKTYGRFVGHLTVAAAGDDSHHSRRIAASQRGRAQAQSALDPVVRQWLAEFDLDRDADEQADELRTSCYRVLSKLAEQAIAALPPTAWRPRADPDRSDRTLPTPGEAHLQFLRAIRLPIEKDPHE